MKRIIIGIDPGVKTGVAVWDRDEQRLIAVRTLPIHRAMELVKELVSICEVLRIRVEDARKRVWYNDKRMAAKAARGLAMGAASVKRDCSIWEGFVTDMCPVPLELVAPKNNKTKVAPERFQQLTGWTGRTSDHSRDAAMLVFGL
jgi:hypothetical protein